MFATRLNWLIATNGNCCFGIEEIALAIGLSAEAASAAAASPLLVAGLGAAEGAAGGAALGALTGTGAGQGALTGGITGGAIGGLGPAIGAATGLGTTAGDIAAGVGGGLVGAGITGGSPLTGALTGGAAGLGAGLLAPGASAAAPAAAAAPTAAVGAGPSPAMTSFPTSGGFPGIFDSSGAAPAVSTQTASADISGGMPGPPAGDTIYMGQSTLGPPTPLTPSTGAAPSDIGGGGPTSPTGNLGVGNWIGQSVGGISDVTGPAAGGANEVGVGNWIGQDVGGITGATTSPPGVMGDIGSWIAKNPGILASTGLLGIEMLRGNQSPVQAQLNQLEQARTGAAGMATALQSPLFTGVLPPGAQGAITASTRNQKAAIRSNYAKAGMAGSTSEAEAMTAVDQNAAAQKFDIENNLFKQAAGYTNMSTGDLTNIISQKRLDDQQFNAALQRFVASLGGARSGTSTPTA